MPAAKAWDRACFLLARSRAESGAATLRQRSVTTRIMQVFAIALALDEESFVPLIDQPISALRAPNYAGPNSPRLR